MPGEGDVTALPLFRRELRIQDSSLFSFWPLVSRELRILLSSIFGEKNPFGFAIFSWTDVEDSFLG
jgi:hypothetical protein